MLFVCAEAKWQNIIVLLYRLMSSTSMSFLVFSIFLEHCWHNVSVTQKVLSLDNVTLSINGMKLRTWFFQSFPEFLAYFLVTRCVTFCKGRYKKFNSKFSCRWCHGCCVCCRGPQCVWSGWSVCPAPLRHGAPLHSPSTATSHLVQGALPRPCLQVRTRKPFEDWTSEAVVKIQKKVR